MRTKLKSLCVYMKGEEDEGPQFIHSVSKKKTAPVGSLPSPLRPHCVSSVCAWQYECVTAALPPAQSRLGPLVHWDPEG